jgi:hypothetical protein
MTVVAILLIVGVVVLVAWVAISPTYSPRGGLDALGLKSGPEITERRAALEAEDLEQMMAARNARRRARGEAEISTEDYEMQLMSEINAQRRKDAEELRKARAKSEDKAAAEAEIAEMLEATNARRRARGLPERTREDLEREFGGS